MAWVPNGQAQKGCPLMSGRWPHKEEVTAGQRHGEAVTDMNSNKQNGLLFPLTLLTMRQDSTTRNNTVAGTTEHVFFFQCKHFSH